MPNFFWQFFWKNTWLYRSYCPWALRSTEQALSLYSCVYFPICPLFSGMLYLPQGGFESPNRKHFSALFVSSMYLPEREQNCHIYVEWGEQLILSWSIVQYHDPLSYVRIYMEIFSIWKNCQIKILAKFSHYSVLYWSYIMIIHPKMTIKIMYYI